MAMNDELVSMAQAFTGLPMRDLIGGPLMAATEANNQMVMTQTRYMLDTGFNRIEVEGSDPKQYRYDPILVNLKLRRPVVSEKVKEDGSTEVVVDQVETDVEVPILTLMPIPTLGVDEVDISFDMEVKSSYGSTQSTSQDKSLAAESSFEAKLGYGPFSVSIKGSVAYSEKSSSSSEVTRSASNSAKYHVQVHASQQDIPRGLDLILKAYSENIGPFTLPKEKEKQAA